MPYTASIDRRNPGCFLFLVDQSRSMSSELAGQNSGTPKMNAAADGVNRVIDNLVQRCSQGMDIRDYFHIGILGYGFARPVPYEEVVTRFTYIYHITNNESRTGGTKDAKLYNPAEDGPIFEETINSILPGTNTEWPFLSISQVADAAQLEDRQVRQVDREERVVEVTRKMPVWLRPHAGMETPMCRALSYAGYSIEQWIAQHPDSFPPIVINITDGEASDGDPEPIAQGLASLRTNDGNALMFNCHISASKRNPIQYPDGDMGLPDAYARSLFRMSSYMPPGSRNHAAALGIPVSAESRCYVFNADMVSLVQFLDIGTRGPVGLE